MHGTTKKQTFDKERISWNTVWMKKHGHHFEMVVDPDLATAYRKSQGGDVKDCLHAEKVFFDAKHGELASEDALLQTFGTLDVLQIAKILLAQGDLQLTSEYREKMREEKRRQIFSKIQMYAIDPTTRMPHPAKRLELAFEEAKIRIDERQDVESQLQDIIRKLQPIIPIRLETTTMQIHLPAPHGQKLYGDLQRFGTIKRTEWLQDGSLLAFLDIPAGLRMDLMEEIGSRTHGAADIRMVDESRMEMKKS